MISKSLDTKASSSASPALNAVVNLAATPARGPSTISASSRNRFARELSPNWVAVCKHITSAADSPWFLAVSAADNVEEIASRAAPRQAATQPRAIANS